MFRANRRHLQPALVSSVNQLPEKHQQRLTQSWAGTFRREFFSRLCEEPFAVLYAEVDSRPNTPVNVLVSLDVLKAGFGWSDEELYDHFLYDLQVRYALGLDSLTDGDFELRTLYNFRRRLSQYNQAHATNLLTAAFADITDQQLTAFKVRTGLQRMDSTQLASNIMDMTRLQLVVEGLQRLQRILSDADQERYAELFAPYVESRSQKYTYRIKGPEATREHLRLAGQALYQALLALKAGYAREPVYQLLERLFAENYQVEAATPLPKANRELDSGCLQSLDDLEASYRTKAGKSYKGYVANVTETCDPANGLQLITAVQVAPNNTDDQTLLAEIIPDLKQRTDVQTLYTDGGYTGPQVDEVMRQHQMVQIPTAIRGLTAAGDQLTLADFVVMSDEQGQPRHITCPQGQTVPVLISHSKKGFTAHFVTATCQVCPLHASGRCPAQPGDRQRYFRLSFNQRQLNTAERRRRCAANKQAAKNLRVAVEATVRSIKHPFPHGKLPVRGRFRMTCLVVASAAMTNIRRIQRYLAKLTQPSDSDNRPVPSENPAFGLHSPIFAWLSRPAVDRYQPAFAG